MLRTPFHAFHVDHGAKLVDFAGWEMPILYRSIHEEHRQVRTTAAMFDVSHMGRLKISGRHARRFLERVLTRRVSDMKELTCRYSLVCNARGGVIDDVIVYKFADHWLVVVNAANRARVIEHFKASQGDMVVNIDDQTQSTAMVALQGPAVMAFIGALSREVPTLPRYGFCIKNYLILKLIISRTGYTGEDGIEIILPAGTASMALKLLVREKPELGEAGTWINKPAGLGARDTLRMEAGMPLYGHELSEEIDPLSAGLGFAVSLDKHTFENSERFIGQDALEAIAKEGPRRKLVGLKLQGRRTARQGMNVRVGEKVVGAVTSGCLSPTLDVPIAMAYVEAGAAEAGTAAWVELGEQKVEAEVVKLPFYKRAK